MYNILQQMRLYAYNQLLSKKVPSTKIDDVEGKDIPQNTKNNDLQKHIANLEESERILLETSKVSCREIKSKSDTDIKDSSKTVPNTAKKCLSLSDLKRHIACMNIKKLTRTQKKEPNIICSSGDNEKKHESIKFRNQIRHKHLATDESPSSCDLFGFYKNRRRKHISPYELYIQSVKPVISKNIDKLKKCSSKVIRRERSAKNIPFPSSHHALKVITSKHANLEVEDQHEDDVFDYFHCFKNRDKLTSIPRQDHKKKQHLPTKNESIMCHLMGNPKHKHLSKKKRRVSIRKDVAVDMDCDNLSADQSIQLPVVITQDSQVMDGPADQSLELVTPNPAPEHEFGCSPASCLSNCKCMNTPSQSAMKIIDNATQTITCKHSYRTRSFSCFLPKPYKKSVQFIANLHISNPDPKSMVKCILICLVVTVWSPILLVIGIGWLLSYPFRPCIVWKRNLQYKRKKVCTCKSQPICNKTGLTKLQYIVQACKMQPSQRQNQKQPYAWSTPFSCRRRDLGRNNNVSHGDFRTQPLHASQHKANTIMNFFHSVFCSSDKIHQSNVSSFRARRNMVALKNNTLKETTLNDKLARYPIKECSPRLLQNLEANKIYPIQDSGTTGEPKKKSVNLQTHDDQDAPFLNTETSKLRNKNTKTDSMNQQIKRKNIFRKVSQTAHVTETNDDKPSQNSNGLRKHTALHSPRCQSSHNEEPKCLHQISSHRKSPLCDKIKEANKTIEPDLPLSETTQRQCNHPFTVYERTGSGHTESLCHRTREDYTTTGINKKKKLSSSKNFRPGVLSKPNEHPFGDDLAVYKSQSTKVVSGQTESLSDTKKANAAVGTNRKQYSCANCDLKKVKCKKKHRLTHHCTSFLKCPIKCSCGKRYKMKRNVSFESDQKPCQPCDYCHKKMPKFRKKPSSTSKYSTSSDVECSCGLKRKNANATDGTNQKSKSNSYCQCPLIKPIKPPRAGSVKSKSNSSCQCHLSKPIKLPPTGSEVSKPLISRKSENLNQNYQKKKKAHAAVETDKKMKTNPPADSIVCKCPIGRNSVNLPENAAFETDQNSMSNSSCQCHLSKPIKLPPTGSEVSKPLISRNSENLNQNYQKKKKAHAAVETDKKMKTNPPAGSIVCKCPIGRNSVNLPENAAFETDRNSMSISSCQCHLSKPNKLPPAGSIVCKCPISRNSVNLPEKAAFEKDRNSMSNSSCQCHLSKPNKLRPAGSVVCKCPISGNSVNLPENAAFETDRNSMSNSSCQCQLSKPNKLPHDDSIVCKCPISRNSVNLPENAAFETDRNSMSNSSCQCHLSKPNKLPHAGSTVCKCPLSRNAVNLPEKAAFETDRNSMANCSCQCHLSKPNKLPPASSEVSKPLISGNSENLNQNYQKMKKAHAAVETDKKMKTDTKSQYQNIESTNLVPTGSLEKKKHISGITGRFGKRNEANASAKMDRNAKSGSDLKNLPNKSRLRLISSKIFDVSKYVKRDKKINTSCQCKNKDLPSDGSQEAKATVGTDPKSKFSCNCECMKYQQDALNVYKLCPISGDTNGLKKKKKLKKHRNNKSATNKFHTPEYLNVSSEVFGSLWEKNGIPHSLSNNNETCRVNKQTRTSKCKPKSPRNAKTYDKCIRESIEAKQPNSLKSPCNDNKGSGQRVTVGTSKPDCKIKSSNESESNTDKVMKNSWTTRYQNASTTAKTRCAHKQCEMKKETQSADKPTQATNAKICATKSQIYPCPPSEQTKFSIEEKKPCSSRAFKKATFATPLNEQTCKRRKPMRAKYLAYTFYDFIVGKNHRKKGTKEPFEPSGIRIKTSDCTRQNYETEPQQRYGGSTELKSRNVNTVLSSINNSNKIGNLKTDGRKNEINKSVEFNYFTMLKDLIDSKTLQNRNVNAQYYKTNRLQSKKKTLSNKMQEMLQQYPYFPLDGHCDPPLDPCSGVSPCISSVCPLNHSLVCKCPIADPKPSCPVNCVCGNSNIKKTNQDCSPQTRCTNTCNPRLSSRRCTNIQDKLSKLCSSIFAKKSKHTLFLQRGFNMLKPKEQKVWTQFASNILEAKKANLSRERISGKGDLSSYKPGVFHLKPAMVTGKGDNSLSFNDKRDLIKMCFKRKVKLTPSLVKCLSDSFNLVSTQQRKHFPRIIDHIKYDKQNKRNQIKLECTGTSKISNATGVGADYICTRIKHPTRHENMKSKNMMRIENVEQCKQRHKRKARKKKCGHSCIKIHHKKIPERKSFMIRHYPDKKTVIKTPVFKKPVVKKPVIKKTVIKKTVIKKPVTKKPVNKKNYRKKTGYKISNKSSRMQTSIYSGRGKIQCSDLYLAALRERPWFWIYKCLPKCYPRFLRFRLCSKTICTQCAFSLTCCLWAPLAVVCIVCYQLFNCCR